MLPGQASVEPSRRAFESLHLPPAHGLLRIACEHAIAPSVEQTNWQRIVDLYDALLSLKPGPVVALNRAIAIAELRGPEAGRRLLRALTSDTALSNYPFFWGALADLERRAGDTAEARKLFRRALSLTRSDADRVAYERKLKLLPDEAESGSPSTPPGVKEI